MAFPEFWGSKSGVSHVCAPLLRVHLLTEDFPEMCGVSSCLSTFQSGGEERRTSKGGGGDGRMIALRSVARIPPFLRERWVIVHLWIKCNRVKQNSTLILFLSFFSLHSILFIPCYSYFFFKIFLFIRALLYFHGTLFCALSAPGRRTQLTLSFSNQDGGLVEEPTTSPFLPSPSLKLPLSNSALPNQTLGGIASGLGMQNLNSSRQVRLLGEIPS